MAMAGRQAKRAEEKAASVLLPSRAAKVKKPSLSKAAVTSMMKAASRTSIGKMQTARLLPQEGRSVQEAIGRMAEAEIAEGVAAAGIAEAAVVALGVAAIAVLVVAVEIAATAKSGK